MLLVQLPKHLLVLDVSPAILIVQKLVPGEVQL
jgi:hypothetical protein